MKKIIRTYLFYLAALFLTSNLLGSSFTIKNDPINWLIAAFILALLNTLLKPILSLLFFPINALTLGFFSIFLNCGIFYLFLQIVPQVQISDWTFPGFHFQDFTVSKMHLPYFGTILLASTLVSLITNFFAFLVE